MTTDQAFITAQGLLFEAARRGISLDIRNGALVTWGGAETLETLHFLYLLRRRQKSLYAVLCVSQAIAKAQRDSRV